MRQLPGDELDRVEPSKPFRDRGLDRVLSAPRVGAARPQRVGKSIVIEL